MFLTSLLRHLFHRNVGPGRSWKRHLFTYVQTLVYFVAFKSAVTFTACYSSYPWLGEPGDISMRTFAPELTSTNKTVQGPFSSYHPNRQKHSLNNPTIAPSVYDLLRIPVNAKHLPMGNSSSVANTIQSDFAMEFPHASAIQSGVGRSIPGSAIYDPVACNRHGVHAFTDGLVTHFATPRPGLHVAAHEAVHQLQHSGDTKDAGMGAERHAHSVANLIVSGVSPLSILGSGGKSVESAVRPYTVVPAATQVASNQWRIGSDARVADTGLLVTSVTDNHVCYAEPSLIQPANLILRAKQSGVRLRAGAAGPSGPAPDGSGVKSTVEVIAQVQSATGGGENWTDCGRMSRDVQGVTGTDAPARGIFRDSIGTQRLTTSGVPTNIRDEALVGAGLGIDPVSALAAYNAMSPSARDAFDMAHGLNRYAAPNVGESFMSVRDDARTPLGFNFHWGGVILISSGDRVTFENFARPGTLYDTQNLLWYFDMYGPPTRVGQTWNDRWAEGPGREGVGVGIPAHGSMTIPTRTSADPSPFISGTDTLATGDLITRRAAATQEGERMALDAELRTRWIKVTVDIVSAQENPDDVYVRAEHGGRSRETGVLSMRTGDRNTFWIRLASIMPVVGPISVKVLDSDIIADDILSNMNLRNGVVTDNRPWDGAEYHTTAEFDR
jgi:hypothetical protein